jgi:NTE family protein
MANLYWPMTDRGDMDDGHSKSAAPQKRGRPPFECIALLLQGGGALGAYQAGVYEALMEADIQPDWVAGISIGAINAALIAGSPPDGRVGKLRQFWEAITESPPSPFTWMGWLGVPDLGGDTARAALNQISAAGALVSGRPGFFAPRLPPPWLHPDGSIDATSYYDTSQLKATLERLVDFDRINAGEMRFSVGAVNVKSGNFTYFNARTHKIGPEHVMASGALPPGFPAIEIDGELYWDGGLVSNTPLQWVLEYGKRQDTLAFQVDLWSARGEFPRNLAEVATRQKEIMYSSRTRDNTDRFRDAQTLRHAVAGLLEKLPPEMRQGREAEVLSTFGDRKVYNIVQLIYRAQQYEGDSKDYEFSRQSMEEHWKAGYRDTVNTLRHPEVLQRPTCVEGVASFDVAHTDQGAPPADPVARQRAKTKIILRDGRVAPEKEVS